MLIDNDQVVTQHIQSQVHWVDFCVYMETYISKYMESINSGWTWLVPQQTTETLNFHLRGSFTFSKVSLRFHAFNQNHFGTTNNWKISSEKNFNNMKHNYYWNRSINYKDTNLKMEIMEQLSKLNIYLSNHYKLSMLLLNQLIK